MSKIWIGMVAAAALLLGGGHAFAQQGGSSNWAVAVELPTAFTYSSYKGFENAGTPSGYLAFIQSPWILGAGYESYTVDSSGRGDGNFTNTTVGTGHFVSEFEFTDVTVSWPMGMGSITFGYGTGSAKLQKSKVTFQGGGGGPSTSSLSTKSASATQAFIDIGAALSARWDFRASLHSINTASVDLLDTGTTTGSKVSFNGNMVALGLAYKL